MDDPDPLLLLVSLTLCASSGVPGLFTSRGGKAGDRIAALFCVAGGALGLFVAVRLLAGGAPLEVWLETRCPADRCTSQPTRSPRPSWSPSSS